MRFFHHTLRQNLPSILGKGLLCRKSRGKRKSVWVHTNSLASWACSHMLARRIGGLDDLVCLEVEIPREWLTRHGKGIWYTDRDIPVERIVQVVEYRTNVVTVR